MAKELELAIKIGGKLDKSLSSAVNSAQQQLNAIGNFANKAGMAVTGTVITAGTKLIVDSIQAAVSYEKAMSGVAKVVDDCRDSNGQLTDTYYELSNGILDMSTKIPMTAEGIASIVESAGQSGIAKDELLGFAESAAKMGVALDVTAEQAGDWMAQWRTSMGLTQPEVETLADQINYLGNTSSEKASKLADVVSRVGSLGKIAGLSGGQVAALAAAMPGVESEVAATGIKNLTKAMTAGDAATTRQSNVLNKLGFSATELAQRMQTDAMGAIMDFLGAIKQLPEAEQAAALTQYFGSASVEAISPLLSNLDNLREQFAKVGDSSLYAGSMQEEYEAASATTANQVQLLENAFTKMKIEIGSKLLPTISEAASKLIDKMPEIENVIVNNLEKIIPAMSKVLDYVVDNSDEIISTVTGIAKAFLTFKAITGVTSGINGMITLFSSLKEIVSSAGAAKTISGILGTLTGSTGALTGSTAAVGGFSSALTGFFGSVIATAAPALVGIGGVTAAIAVMSAISGHINFHWADNMLEQSEQLNTQTAELRDYVDTAQELNNIEMVLKNPESSAADIEAAKQRLQEIAELCGVDYTVTIASDTSGVDTETLNAVEATTNALNKENAVTLSNSITDARKLVENEVGDSSSIKRYQHNKQTYEQSSINLAAAQAQEKVFTDSAASFNRTLDNYQSGIIDQATFIQQADAAYKAATGSSLQDKYADKNYDASWYTEQYGNYFSNRSGSDWAYTSEMSLMTDEIENSKAAMATYEETVSNTATSLRDILAADVVSGNAENTAASTKLFEEFGAKIKDVGVNTDEAAVAFATAKAGYTDFAAAIEAGKVGEMTQSYIDFKTQIGETAENAVQGAALVANGFTDAASAAAAGDEAIKNTITTMQQLGNQQGLFDGLDSGGIADKLTDMAHAMDLIPENKSITIDANGDFSVIAEAENQIASLNSVGNVDVSVNANGDFSILNEATGEISTLQGMGAVSLSVNADGNIDVLDEAQQTVATIDSKSAQVSIDGAVYGMEAIEEAKNAASNLTDKNVSQTVTGSFPGKVEIQTGVDYQSKLADVSKSQKVAGTFSGQGNIATALSYQSQLQNKSVTYTVTYVQNGTPAKNATGSINYGGGLTYVNDQGIADPREVIKEPSGFMYYYTDRNVLANVPRGSRIYTAAESRAFINGSHKNGLDRVPYDGYIAELHANEKVLTEDEAEDYRNGGELSRIVDELIKMLGEPAPGKGEKDDDGGGGRQIIYSPQFVIQGGDADTGDKIRAAARMTYSDFTEYMDRYESDRRRKSF